MDRRVLTGDANETGQGQAFHGGDALPGGPLSGARSAIDRNTLFSLLPPAGRTYLLKLGFLRRYAPGEWVTREGQHSGRVFLIVSGTVQLLAAAGRGRYVVVRTLRTGDAFGFPGAGVVHGTTAARAFEDTETCVFPSEAIQDQGRQSPLFHEAVERFSAVQETEAFLRRASPFASLPPEVLLDLAANMKPGAIRAGEVLFSEGDEGDAMYLILRGSVGVEIDGQHVTTLRLGDCVGEAALVTNLPRSATIRAQDETALLRLDRGAFERVLNDHEEVNQFFIELLRRRDLLTPSVERQAGRATPRPTDATRAAERSNPEFASARNLFVSIGSLSALLAVLSWTVNGHNLAAPSQVLAVGATLAAAYRIERIPLVRNGGPSLAKLLILELLGLLVGLTWEAPFWSTLQASPAAVFLLKTAAVPLLTMVIISVASLRRGLPLEMDALVAGSALGLGAGAGRAVFFWFVTGPVPASDLAAAAWLELLLVPGIHVAILGMLGAGLWRARSQRSPQSLLAALGLALLSLSLAHL
ncbi:MAG: cyclic nucleotide-binding domain-containing protein, partial [Chloroflexota bacterium]